MRTRQTITRIGTTLGGCAMIALAVGTVSGCRGDRSDNPPRQFFPDLDDQLKWKPQSKSEFYADGRTMRQPVQHTVAFGRVSLVSHPQCSWVGTERDDLRRDDDAFYRGTNADGTFIERIPVEVSARLIERGRERYNIYCVVCHGYAGDGRGMVGVQFNPAAANLHDPKYKAPDKNDPKVQLWKDGYIFSAIRNGVQPVGQPALSMPSYAHAIDERDAWAIVSYVRTLQESHTGTMQDVPESERAVIERQRAAMIEAAKAAEAVKAAEEKAKAEQNKGAAAPKQTPGASGGK